MLSRRSLFALMGAAAAAPMAAVAAPKPGKVIISVLDPATNYLTERYTFTSYGRGYVVTEREAVAWFDPRGHFHVGDSPDA